MFVRGLKEVVLYVEDMNAEVAFYRDKLGLEVLSPKGRGEYSGEMWVTLSAGECALALHGGGHRRFGEDAPCVVFRVSSVPSAREALRRRGVVTSAIRSASPGILACDGKDPEGNKFSLEAGE